MVGTRQGLTLEQFLELPEDKPALEYFDGAVTQKVAPKIHHSALQGQLVWLLTQLVRPRRLARVFPELRTTYEGASYVPDVSVYRWERVPRTADGQLASDAYTLPDLAIEIRSPGQSVRDLARRCEWYVAHGVAIALLVDHRDESIRAFRPDAPASVHRGSDRIDLSAIAAGLELVVSEVFAALDAG